MKELEQKNGIRDEKTRHDGTRNKYEGCAVARPKPRPNDKEIERDNKSGVKGISVEEDSKRLDKPRFVKCLSERENTSKKERYIAAGEGALILSDDSDIDSDSETSSDSDSSSSSDSDSSEDERVEKLVKKREELRKKYNY